MGGGERLAGVIVGLAITLSTLTDWLIVSSSAPSLGYLRSTLKSDQGLKKAPLKSPLKQFWNINQ